MGQNLRTITLCGLALAAPILAAAPVDFEFGNHVPATVARAAGDWSVLKAPPEYGPFLTKRIEGMDLHVIEAATMEGQDDPNQRWFAVIDQPSGYTWRFSYDVRDGKPDYSLERTERIETVEVRPPGHGHAFIPTGDVDLNHGLHCRNSQSCIVSGVPIGPCIVCYCASGSLCDSDDTGVYTDVVRPIHITRVY